MTDFLIRVVIDPRNASTGARKVRTELGHVESAASEVGKQLKRAFGAAALIAGATAGIRTLANFSQEMSTVAAITEATAEQFEELEERAISLGTKTRFSATQAAEGMTFLARAGFDANATLETIEDTLFLAQSGALELGRAADIASNALTAFRLDTAEAGRVVDVLALAANSSNTTVAQLGDGLKLVAPIAAGVGVEIEEVTGAISALSNAGLQATLAGTGLRRVISELESPSTKTKKLLGDLGLEADEYKVSSVGLTTALERLAQAGVDTGLGLEVFGDRGGPAFEVLSASIDDVKIFTHELNEADGTAERIAATMDDNLNGSLLALRSAFEGLTLRVGEAGATGALRGFVDLATVGLRTAADNAELVTVSFATLATTVAAVKLAPLFSSADAWIALRIAVLKGNAVILGSAAATRAQAAAEVQAAQAVLTKTAATVAQIQAETSKALVVAGSAETTFIQAAVEKQAAAAQVAHAQAATALTAAQTKLAAATAATTIRARALALVNPFAVAVGGAAAFGYLLNKMIDELVEIEDKMLAITEQGNKFELTEAGKVGDDLLRIQENVDRVEASLARMREAGDENSETYKSQEAILERYRAQLGLTERELELVSSGQARNAAAAAEQAIAEEKLVRAIDSVIEAVAEENGLLALNRREREIQATLLQQIAALEEKSGLELSDAQAETLETTIRRNQALREQADVLERIRGPQQQFQTDLDALSALLESGTISQAEFTDELTRMAQETEGIDFAGLDLGDLDIDPADLSELRDLFREIADIQARLGETTTFETITAGIEESNRLLGLNSRERSLQLSLARELDALERARGAAVTGEEAAKIEALLRENQALEYQARILEDIQGPGQQFEATQTALNDLLDSGAISAEQYAIALNDAAIAAARAGGSASQGFAAGMAQVRNDLLDVSGAVQSTVVNAFGAAEDALVQFATTGEADFGAMVDGILADLARLLAKQALMALINSFGGGAGGAIGSALSGAFGGGRAGGGDVAPNQAYVVGEEGAEIFTPTGAGRITPAGETAAIMQQQSAAPVVNVAAPSVKIINVVEGDDDAQREADTINYIRRNRRTVKGLVS